jgi:hypothetical protein
VSNDNEKDAPSAAMWARLDERMFHIVSAVDDIKRNMATKGEIANLVNKAAHDSAISNLQTQIDGLKTVVKDQSASSWMDRIRAVALTLIAVATASGVIVAIVRSMDRFTGN